MTHAGCAVRRFPTLEHVLAEIRPGRVAYLQLSREQKCALRDPDGQLALDVLRHLLGARAALNAPERFPLTEFAAIAVARKLGQHIGQRRARSLRRRLEEAGVVESSGDYRQPYVDSAARSGYRVHLVKIARSLLAPPKSKHPVGKSSPRKRLRWYQHPLFGDYDGLPPPGTPKRWLRRMVSLDEVSAPATPGRQRPTAFEISVARRP